MSEPNEERIPASAIVVYSSPVLGVFMAGMLVNFYLLKFSTDVLLIGPAAIGFILLAARLWDAVTDPAVGFLSDRTQSRLGRRRPWFLASAIPLGISIVMLWSPPLSLEGGYLTAWIACAILLFYTAYTMFRVPHIALGAELSRGYHDRTRVFGIMQAVESIGMLAAAVALSQLEGAEDPRSFARWLSLIIAGVTVSLIVFATLNIRERAEFQGKGGGNPWQSFGDVLKNPHARILIFVFFLEQLGFSAIVALMPYLSDYVVVTPGRTAVYLFAAVMGALVSIPFWIKISRRFGKKPVWLTSLGLKAGTFACAFLLAEGDFIPMLVIALAVGILNGSGSVIGPSLKADVVDWDEGQTGERKEGSYFATWNFVQKAAGGVSVWVIGVTLATTGFEPNVAQSAEALSGMKWLASLLPAILHILAIIVLARFSLTESEHQAARSRANAKSAAV